MSTTKILVKKLILFSGLRKLSISKFITRVLVFAKLATDNPTIVPNLDPTPATIKLKADALTQLVSERTALKVALKSKTAAINIGIRELLTLINYRWGPQTQNAIGGSTKLAKMLGWFMKGHDTGEAPAKAIVGSVYNSNPIITKIDSSTHLKHTIYTRNSANGKAGLPKDAFAIDIYYQIGGDTPPIDIKNMAHLGLATRGNVIAELNIEDIGKTVYYIAVYLSKKNKKPLTMSPVMSAAIN